jgi:hypothetical protein
MKIAIIGGGIAGLSAATILCERPNLDITIYEKEHDVGGQASSLTTSTCNTEYSWRIYGGMYYNLLYILFTKLKIQDNFEILRNNCFIDGDKNTSAELSLTNQLFTMLSTMKVSDYHKICEVLILSKERLMRDYDINAYEYFNKNPIVQTILGPFLGMDANKVSLAGAIKNIYATTDTTSYDFVPGTHSYVTLNPTSHSIFSHWKKYLMEKGVTIRTDSDVGQISILDKQIKSITLTGLGQTIIADEYIFACSLGSILDLFQHNYNCTTLNNMKKMRNDLQLYFTINMYFSKRIEDIECRQEIIVDMPWKPIIQRKLSWSKEILDKCYYKGVKIEEVWNVGFLDWNIGKYNNKILRDCSIEEAIEEGVKQVKENPYTQQILASMNETFDRIYLGCEYWYQFKNNSEGKLISENPKFSINVGTMKNMPETCPEDMPTNMCLAGYYVNSSVGGVSMEASCETGLNAGKHLIDKYGLEYNDRLPIRHTHELFTILTLPLVLFDKLLFAFGLPAITNYIDSFYLCILYIVFLFCICVYGLYKTIGIFR